MQFKVPQFIDVEDKLFGPFTFKQFAYMAGGAGLIYVLYKLLPLWLSIIIIIPVFTLVMLLVFYKVNNKPFSFYLQAGFSYLLSKKLFIWKQRLIKPGTIEDKEPEAPRMTSVIPMTTGNDLKDLSWSLDIKQEEGEKNN